MKLYGLFLNMMRDHSDRIDLVAVADSIEKLKIWADYQRAEVEYQDGTLSAFGGVLTKTYKKGSALEYYNPPENWDLQGDEDRGFRPGVTGLPSRDEWIRQAAESAARQWDTRVALKRI